MTALTIEQVQAALAKLGYFDGAVDGDYHGENFRDDLRRFQRDYPATGTADGVYGDKTEAVLLPLAAKLEKAPPGFTQCRRWHLTYYYIGDVKAWGGTRGGLVPMKTPGGVVLEQVPPGAFAEAALEGTTKLSNGQLATVAQPAYGPADPVVFKPVLDIALRNDWVPEKTGYAGITVADGRVTGARNFELKAPGPGGWPVEARKIECNPFRTLAADNGKLPRHDPRFKGKGGVVPAGTAVWILEFVGMKLPDGTVHDGWFTVNDTGGGIFGAHFDVFTGTRTLAKAFRIPDRAHVWFTGVEDRLSMGYAYGL